MRLSGLSSRGLSSMMSVLLRDRKRPGKEKGWEEGSRDWILVTTNQRTPKNASQLSEIGRNLSQSLQREHSPMHTLISDFLPPQL